MTKRRKNISCILILLAITKSSSALSPLATITSSTKSIPSERIRRTNTKLNLSSGNSDSLFDHPSQQSTQQRWASDYDYTTGTTLSPDMDTPTLVQQHIPPPDQIPPTPKLVLFGATGKIGRRILKKIMSAPLDIEVVAFVRNQQRLEEVLYDEEDLVLGNLLDNEKKRGPKLTVVVGDVVARTDLYKGTFETKEETEELNEWVARAQDFFRFKGWNSNRNSTSYIQSLQDQDQIEEDVRIMEAGDEALQEAVSGATIIISCLSSLRYSNLWTDYLKVPFLRVFRQDASKWCADGTHPYYINYLSTKKILEVAEREQLKRDAYNEFERERLLLEEQMERGRKLLMNGNDDDAEEEGFESEIAAGLRKKRGSRQRQLHLVAGEDAVDLPKNGLTPSSTDRIKFIRVSHSNVGRNPFRLGSIVNNVFRSSVTRFELLGEQLLEKSRLIDTIILRPGEVTDIERDSNTTSLQLCIDGDVPSPNLGLVGRDDIADLAVVAALTKTSLDDELSFSSTSNATDVIKQAKSTARPHHYTWSLRWTGEGSKSTALCFVKAIKNEMKLSRIRKMKEKKLMQYHLGSQLLSLRAWMRRTRPHALSVALTVYVSLIAAAWYFFGSTILEFALRARRHNLLQRFFPL